jgi:uncharacterized protein (DUF1684 family)
MTSENESFESAWQAWRQERAQAVTAPFGLAALVATHWLDSSWQSLDGLPGRWMADAGDVVGTELPRAFTGDGSELEDEELRIRPGEQIARAGLQLRHMQRDGVIALRILDSQAAGRLSLQGIDVFPPDAAWRGPGRDVPAPTEQSVEITSVAGYVREQRVAGTVEFVVDGHELALTVSGEPRELSAVFADATSGAESFHFRFLDLEPVASDGSIVVDFTRAYLPPCAFSDFYVCPLPLPGNRMPVAIRAGEKALLRA